MNMLRHSFSVSVIALSYASTAFGQELDVARIYRSTAPSVGVVIALDEHRQPLALGSGFFLDASGAFATNYHVIAGAHSVQVKWRDELLTVNGVYAASADKDLAVLAVEVTGTTPPLALSAVRPTIGERIVSIGNPLGLEASVSEGIVSGIRQLENLELYQITSPISPGSSGGPVLNARGEVIGVATATLRGGQNLNFAVPAAELDGLWKTAGTPQALQAVAMSEATLGIGDDESTLIRFVDTNIAPYGGPSSTVLYNGTQYTIRSIQIRVICNKSGIDVPIDYYETTLLDELNLRALPPGLSEPFQFYCRSGTTQVDVRVFDYAIVR